MTIFTQPSPSCSRFFRHARAYWPEYLFGLVLMLHLLPIWALHRFPTTDGPAHVYNAWLLKLLLTQPEHPFQTYLAVNAVPVPNYLTSVLLAGALQVLPAWLAEKLVQTLFVAGLPLGVRYALRAWRPDAGFLAFLAFPLIYSAVFQLGFYNFCLSLVLLLLVAGYWRRHFYRRAAAGRHVGGLGTLFLLLYFAHPLTYLLAGLVLGAFLLEASFGNLWLPGATGHLATFKAGFLSLLLACLPSLLLLGWWLRHPANEQQLALPSPGTGQLLHDWLLLEPLRFMGSAEGTYRLLLTALLLGLVAYVVWQHWRRKAAGGMVWGFIIGVLLLGYVFLPDALLGGSIIRPRLGLLSYLFVLGLLGTGRYPAWLRQAVVGVTVLVAVLLLHFRLTKYQTWATGLAEYQSAAPHLRPGASLVSFTYGPITRLPNGKEYKSYIDVFSHAASNLSFERQLLNLENYEAHTGYFPLVWRPGQELLMKPASHPARAHWLAYPRPQWPDYVVVWARSQHPQPSAPLQELTTHLRQNYRLIFTSQTGLLELYEHKPCPQM